MADLNEIVRTRVRSLGGNCVIGYHVYLHGFDHIIEENKVYLIMSAIGDAVHLVKKRLFKTNSTLSDENAAIRDLANKIEEEKLQ